MKLVVVLVLVLDSLCLQAAPWVNVGPLNVARHSHTATLLLDGKVLVAGGFNLSDLELSRAELYDPATGQWTPTGAMNTPREFHSAVSPGQFRFTDPNPTNLPQRYYRVRSP